MAKPREAVIDEDENRCYPLFICVGVFVVCPRMAELRRASPTELRCALLRAKKHPAAANTSGL